MLINHDDFGQLKLHAYEGNLPEVARKLMNNYHDGRICQNTLDFYRADPENVLTVVVVADRITAAISCCHLTHSQLFGGIFPFTGLKHQITITHAEYRKHGLGAMALRHKVEQLNRRGIKYYSHIATDNPASCKTAERVGLTIVETAVKIRGNGEYEARIYA